MLFFLRTCPLTNDWDICEEDGTLMKEADAFCQQLVEARLASWREKNNDAPPVELVEWVEDPPKVMEIKFFGERDTGLSVQGEDGDVNRDQTFDRLYGPFTAIQLIALITLFSPKPWKGHPAYEG